MAFKGRNMFLRVLVGSSYVTIAGLQTKTATISRDSVDITTEDESPWRELMADVGMANVSISANGIFKDDAAMNKMEDMSYNGNIGTFQLIFENGDILGGDFQVTSFEYSTEVGNALMSSITLESADIQTLTRGIAAPPDLVALEQEIGCTNIGGQCGLSVAIYDDTLVVGAPIANGQVGEVNVYTRSGTTWSLQQTFTGSDSAGSDRFGWSVSIYEDTIVVGAPLEELPATTDTGAVYVFTRTGTTWTEQQKIKNSIVYNQEQFGNDVKVYQDTLIAGAPNRAERGTGTGGASIFVRSGGVWTFQQAFLHTGTVFGSEHFGQSVGLYGETAIVGAYDEVVGGSRRGVLYVYTRSGTTWSLQQKLTASDGAPGDQFGYSCDIFEDTIIVGSWLADVTGNNSGAAYTFTRVGTTWTQQQKLVPAVSSADDTVGESVAIDNDTILIGALSADDPPVFSNGQATRWLLQGGVWVEKQTLRPTQVNTNNDLFGNSVALHSNIVVVGANGYDVTGTNNEGAAFVYT